MREDPVLVIAGPTAVGKSALALEVAGALDGEIVSVDSRQVYRGMDVGTATPSKEELDRVPHHLISTSRPAEALSAGEYLTLVNSSITDVQASSSTPVLVGGSTLYLDAIINGLADLPPVSDSVYLKAASEAASRDGLEALYDELHQADPQAAETLDQTKSQRVVRLVSLLRETGRPPSQLWRELARPAIPHRLIVLDRPRPELYRRIEARVDRMVTNGLEDETRGLLGQGPGVRRLLESTIGYREMVAHIDGELSHHEAVRLIKRDSRRYAKRQLTWFRRYQHARWLDAGTTTPQDVIDVVASEPDRT